MKINHKQPNSSWKAGRLLNDESGVYFECSSLSWTSRPGNIWQLPLMIAARTRGCFDPDCHVMWTVSMIRWILTQPWIYQRHFSFVAACVDMYTKLFWKLLYALIFIRSCSHYIIQKQIQEGECSRSSLNGGGSHNTVSHSELEKSCLFLQRNKYKDDISLSLMERVALGHVT